MNKYWFCSLLTFVLCSTVVEAEELPTYADLLARPVHLKPQLEGAHPRVFVTAEEIVVLRERPRTTHRAEWARVIATLAALKREPPKPPGPQERRAQNT